MARATRRGARADGAREFPVLSDSLGGCGAAHTVAGKHGSPTNGEAVAAAATPAKARARRRGAAGAPAPALPAKALDNGRGRGRRGSKAGGGGGGDGSSRSEESMDTTSPPPSPGSAVGTGWGGVRTPADDFQDRRRRSAWCNGSPQALPPRVYIDNKTLIRQVQDMGTLRSGDHCVIAINMARAAAPLMDHFVSFLGSIEICYFYHHFIVLDDVDHVDENGVPRTADGDMAMIVEWGNTIPEACTEIFTTVGSRLYQFPRVVLKFVFTGKAKFNRHALANYGDTPHVYLVLEEKSKEERERIVSDALCMYGQEQSQYNIFWNNCEHACSKIKHGSHRSAQVVFLLWTLFRCLLGLIGLLVLKANQDWSVLGEPCRSALCVGQPSVAMATYHLFTSVSVALQAMISYILLVRSVLWQRRKGLINRHDCLHLLGKEFGRGVVVGTWTVLAMSFAPKLTSHFFLRLIICMLAYLFSDMVYNLFAHAVMRLVLLPFYGRVWLFGPTDDAKEKAS